MRDSTYNRHLGLLSTMQNAGLDALNKESGNIGVALAENLARHSSLISMISSRARDAAGRLSSLREPASAGLSKQVKLQAVLAAPSLYEKLGGPMNLISQPGSQRQVVAPVSSALLALKQTVGARLSGQRIASDEESDAAGVRAEGDTPETTPSTDQIAHRSTATKSRATHPVRRASKRHPAQHSHRSTTTMPTGSPDPIEALKSEVQNSLRHIESSNPNVIPAPGGIWSEGTGFLAERLATGESASGVGVIAGYIVEKVLDFANEEIEKGHYEQALQTLKELKREVKTAPGLKDEERNLLLGAINETIGIERAYRIGINKPSSHGKHGSEISERLAEMTYGGLWARYYGRVYSVVPWPKDMKKILPGWPIPSMENEDYIRKVLATNVKNGPQLRGFLTAAKLSGIYSDDELANLFSIARKLFPQYAGIAQELARGTGIEKSKFWYVQPAMRALETPAPKAREVAQPKREWRWPGFPSPRTYIPPPPGFYQSSPEKPPPKATEAAKPKAASQAPKAKPAYNGPVMKARPPEAPKPKPEWRWPGWPSPRIYRPPPPGWDDAASASSILQKHASDASAVRLVSLQIPRRNAGGLGSHAGLFGSLNEDKATISPTDSNASISVISSPTINVHGAAAEDAAAIEVVLRNHRDQLVAEVQRAIEQRYRMLLLSA